ncbi:MAG: tetratricopeptide repeat protein, partial [Gaiellaceae bacterium]
PASERSARLPPSVDAVFARALAKDPAYRYESGRELVAALRGALAPPPAAEPVPAHTSPPPRRRSFAPALALALLLVALAGGAGLAALLAGDGGEQGTTERAATREGTTVPPTVTTGQETSPPASGLSSDEAAVLNDDAFALMQEGRWEEALPLLRRALPALRGTYSDGFRFEAYAEYNIGKTLAELGRCEEALPHLERSEKLQGAREPITAAKRQCQGD